MMKIAKVNAAIAPIGTSATRFRYVLNDESTLEKLKRNALTPDLHVNRDNRDGSVSIELNTGAYLSAMVPLVQFYKKNKGREVDGRQTKGLKLFITHETFTARTIDLRASQKLILPILNQDADTCSSDMSEEENEDDDSENWITNQKQTDIESIQQSLSSVAEPQPRTMADDQLQQHRLSNTDHANGNISSTADASRGLEGGATPVRTEGD